MPKQTAVEWLWHHFNVAVTKPSEEMLEIALEKEKEQMIEFTNNYLRQIYEVGEMTISDFYNETYASSPKTSDN